MAETIISTIMEQLSSILLRQAEHEVTLVLGVKEEVESLTSSFQAIQAVCDDAERKQTKDAHVRQWFDKLKDVSYDVDDVLDEWNTAILKVQIEGGQQTLNKSTRQACCFFIPASSSCCFCFRQIAVRRDIAIKIKDLKKRLDVIEDEKRRYSFNSTVRSTIEESYKQQRMTVSIIDVAEIVGRDNDKDRLVDVLLSESCHGPTLPIISIIGMGGLGKTTLAQLAYNDERTRTHFEKRTWVCVSDPFDEISVAKAILEELRGSTPSLNELNPLLQSISESVEGKKFLLVLDDVWCEEYDRLQQLKNSLKRGSPGSRILVTTRNETVANAIGSSTKFFLGALTEEECWDLFGRVAFSAWTNEEREYVEDISHKILGKCGGLPLAIKTLGGFLCMKKCRQEWLDVLESDLWKMTEEKGVFPPLLLSYYDLSPMLRRCFSYCAVFPKDYLISKDEVIKMWMAQGYFGIQNTLEMEIIGEECFNELAMRSFFQDFVKNDNGTIIERCKMHDIVHDFAQYLTKNECLATTVNNADDDDESILKASCFTTKTRHLMLEHGPRVPIPISICNLISLRTLKISGDVDWASFDEVLDKAFDQLTCRRTLDLSNTFIIQLSEKVGKLIHLRYLSLEFCRKLRELPETVCDLYNLQALNVCFCNDLERLPSGLGKLINLRQLEFESCYKIGFIPRGINKLRWLRRLDQFVVSNLNEEEEQQQHVSTLGDLMNFNQLRGELTIKGLVNVKEASEAKKAQLHKKKFLTDLILRFDGGRIMEGEGKEEEEKRIMRRDEQVLEALQPHPNLQVLNIRYYRGSMVLPNCWTMSLTNLRDLVLLDCPNCEFLPPLGNLPSLESLYLFRMDGVKTVGIEFLGTLTSLSSSSPPPNPIVFFPKLKKTQSLFHE